MNFKMLFAILVSFFVIRADFVWTQRILLIDGPQFDVDKGPDGKIHLISSSYNQIDEDGNVTLTEDHISDDAMGDMRFPPALATGPDSSVHIVTRHGGTWSEYTHIIRYRRRGSNGTWSSALKITDPVDRNYVVGVAVLDNNRVFCMHSRQNGTNVHADIHMYEVVGSSLDYLGKTTSRDWLRIDADYRVDSYGNSLHLFSGSPWPTEDRRKTYYFSTNVTSSTDVPAALSGSKKEHNDGTGRQCLPDVCAWGAGGTDIVYGAENTVYYNRYLSNGNTLFGNDKKVLDNLGDWHLKSGSSAIGVSDDGQKVLVVGIQSDGGTRGNGNLVYTFSEDGGQTFSAKQNVTDNLGESISTLGGEGRLRPRMVWFKERFMVFYHYGSYNGRLACSIFKEPQTKIDESSTAPQEQRKIIQINPNPFNPLTTITLHTSEGSKNINLSIYNPNGNLVKKISNFSGQSSGSFSFLIDSSEWPSGTYVARAEINGKEFSKRMLLLK